MIDTKIAIFKGKQIRKTIYKNEWWFSIVDVVWALTDSVKLCCYQMSITQRDRNKLLTKILLNSPRPRRVIDISLPSGK